MTVFDKGNYGPLSGGSMKPCQRDIESEIKEHNGTLSKEQAFLDALYAYLEGAWYPSNMDNKFSLGELVGLLELGIRSKKATIIRLMKELEAEKR